jgi:hypothetical protein
MDVKRDGYCISCQQVAVVKGMCPKCKAEYEQYLEDNANKHVNRARVLSGK